MSTVKKAKSIRSRRRRSGQAMVEFVVVAGMLLATVAIMMVFLGTFREYGTRVLNLVGSEYP
jgi:Flp pilus assembly protein TadG